MKVRILLNPKAGAGRAARLLEPLRGAAGPGAELIVPESAEETRALARSAGAEGVETLVAVGGDGTVLVGRQALRDAMAATAGFDGLSGNLTCTPTGDCATGEALGVFEITSAEINDGNWPPEAIWTP